METQNTDCLMLLLLKSQRSAKFTKINWKGLQVKSVFGVCRYVQLTRI